MKNRSDGPTFLQELASYSLDDLLDFGTRPVTQRRLSHGHLISSKRLFSFLSG